MITRVHGASSTLAANPPRRKRKPARRKGTRRATTATKRRKPVARRKPVVRRRRRSAPAKRLFNVYARTAKTKTGKKRLRWKIRKNPDVTAPTAVAASKRRKRKARAVFGVYASGKGKRMKYVARRNKKKNPALMFAGVPVIEMAIGAVAAIGLGHAASKLISKYAPAGLPSFLTDADTGIAGELAIAGVSAYLYAKVLKNPMQREIAKYAFIGSVFQIISKTTKDPIQNAIDSALGGMGGVYFNPYTGQQGVGGVYLPAPDGVNGLYQNTEDMGGLGLFKAPSIYG